MDLIYLEKPCHYKICTHWFLLNRYCSLKVFPTITYYYNLLFSLATYWKVLHKRNIISIVVYGTKYYTFPTNEVDVIRNVIS